MPWRKAWQPTPVFLPGESHRERSQVVNSPQHTTEVTEHAYTVRASVKAQEFLLLVSSSFVLNLFKYGSANNLAIIR